MVAGGIDAREPGNKKNIFIMKNILLFSIGLLLLSSCNLRNSGCTCNNHTEHTWVLRNRVLHNAILEYIDSVPLEGEGIVSLTYFHIDDSTVKFRISYITNSFELRFRPPLLFFRVNDHLVSFAIDNPDFRHFAAGEVFALCDNSLIDIVEQEFPKQYEYVLRTGNLPFSIRKEIPTVMELTFRHRELIEQRIKTPEWRWHDRKLSNAEWRWFNVPLWVPPEEARRRR